MSGVGGDIWGDLPEYKSPSQTPAEGHDIWSDAPDYSPETVKHAQQNKPAPTVMDKLLGRGTERYQTWPERMARDIAHSVHSAVTAPQDVLEGRLDPNSEEGVKRAFDVASTFSPINPAARVGDFAIAGAQRRPTPPATTPSLDAARAGLEAGQGLPRGKVSPNPIVRFATDRLEQLPFVGSPIKKGVAETVGKVGQKVEGMAEDLAGGELPLDRAEAGAALRPSIEGAVKANNQRIGEAYDALRAVTDTEKPAPLPRTTKALEEIRARRVKAGEKPDAGLENVARLVDEGATRGPGTTRTELKGPGYHIAEDIAGEPLTDFNSLQRARNGVGHDIKWGKSNQGYNEGDLKHLYGAMSEDMKAHVAQNVRPGAHPDAAVAALDQAHTVASKLINENGRLGKLAKIENDEGLIGRVVNAAKGGNARMVEQLRNSLPKEDFDLVVGGMLKEMGHDAEKNAFSFDKFAKEWGKISPTARQALFPDATHRSRLDAFANMSKLVKAGDLPVGPGAGAVAGGAAAELGIKLAKTLFAAPKALVGVLGGLAGGTVLARALARPATAATVARWTATLHAAGRSPSPAAKAALVIATRNMMHTLEYIPGFSKEEFLQRLKDPEQGSARNK